MLRNTLLAIAIASVLVACGKPDGASPKGAADAGVATKGKADDKKLPRLLIAPEDLLTVQSDSLASGPVITGSIQPERKADLRAEVGAVVLQVLKENGDLLVRLDETSIRDSLTSAEEAVRSARQVLDQAERMLERNKTLRTSGMTSMQALEDAEVRRNTAQSEVVAAKARLAQARQQLERTNVRAPFDGIVSERKVSNGDTAQVGKELIKVIDPSSMRFEGLVSADKIGIVKVGQPVLFRVNGYPGQNFQGKIKRVDPAANPVTRQVEVLVEFADKLQPRVAGLYAEGRVEAESSNALMIPASALVQAGDSNYAWKIKNNKLAKVNLGIGTRDERSGMWQVTTGLSAGDLVLRAPGATAHDGQPVQLTAAKNVASAAQPATAVKGN